MKRGMGNHPPLRYTGGNQMIATPNRVRNPMARMAYSGRRQKYWVAWVLVAPALLLRLLTTLYPFCMTFYNSLFDLSLFRGSTGTFVGLENFIKMFTDTKFLDSLDFTTIFTLCSMLFHFILGIALALMLNQRFRGKKLLRTVTLMPWAMPMVVVGIAARWAFNGQYGMIFYTLIFLE